MWGTRVNIKNEQAKEMHRGRNEARSRGNRTLNSKKCLCMVLLVFDSTLANMNVGKPPKIVYLQKLSRGPSLLADARCKLHGANKQEGCRNENELEVKRMTVLGSVQIMSEEMVANFVMAWSCMQGLGSIKCGTLWLIMEGSAFCRDYDAVD